MWKMIQSDILKEKLRIKKLLSGKSTSIHEYLTRSQLAAKAIADTYGFHLKYVEMPKKTILLPTPSTAVVTE